MADVLELSKTEQFDEIINDPERPTLVDFWADWCGPCKMVAPVIERLAKEYDGRMTFAKVNVDELPEISNRYSVRSIPTLIVFRGGKAATRITGFKPENALRPQLDRYALPKPESDQQPDSGEQPEAPVEKEGGFVGTLKRLFTG